MKFRTFLLLFGLWSIWEAASCDYRETWYNNIEDNPFIYFLLYHTGDINNTAISTFVLWIGLKRFLPKRNIAILISAIVIWLAFIYIERNDLLDLPFAFIGIVMTIILTWNKGIRELMIDQMT